MNIYKIHKVLCLILALGSCLFSGLYAEKANLTGFPVIAYSNETHLMLGGFLIWDKKWEYGNTQNRNTIITNAILTTNKQYLAFILPRFSRNDGDLTYSADLIARRWSDKFYGIGNNSREQDMEPFGWEEYKFNLNFGHRIYSRFSAGAELDLRYSDLYKSEAGSILTTGNIEGSKPAYYLGKGINLSWDNTDAETYPTRGLRYKAELLNYTAIDKHQTDKVTGQDIVKGDFEIVSLDLNHYLPIAKGIVLASQSTLMQTENAVPFTFLPELGSRLRAYDSKRFIDKSLVAQRIEPRIFPAELPIFSRSDLFQSKFWQRTGFVMFSEFGQVAPHIQAMQWKSNHVSTGFGIRYAIIPEDKLNFRMDMGWGKHTFNFIFQAREVF